MVNPYESSQLSIEQLDVDKAVPRRILISQGLILGGGIPFAVGALMLIRARMLLPVLEPGQAHSGTNMLGPLCLMFLGSPMGALIGAITGAARWFQVHQAERAGCGRRPEPGH